MKINYRTAVFQDVEQMHKLLNDYAQEGLMLPRSRNNIYENIRDYIVAMDEQDNLIGVGALHMVWDRLAEVRSLAVNKNYKKQGIGKTIVEKLEKAGETLGVETLFTLTYQPGFFEKCGYSQVPNDSLPQKVWKECIYCPKYPYCDEIALIKKAKTSH